MLKSTLIESGYYSIDNEDNIDNIVTPEVIKRIENHGGVLISKNPPLWIIDTPNDNYLLFPNLWILIGKK